MLYRWRRATGKAAQLFGRFIVANPEKSGEKCRQLGGGALMTTPHDCQVAAKAKHFAFARR